MIILLILIAFLVLSILVVIHEFGHFWVAKKFGVYVEEFGVGLPPRAWGKKIGETLYSLNWIPLGGFVKLHGEVGEEKVAYPNRAFVNKGAIPRILIALAGIAMNLIFAVFAFSVVYTFQGIPKLRELGHVVVTGTTENSPAQIAGFRDNDIVVDVNGKKFTQSDEFIKEIENLKGNRIRVNVERILDGEKKIVPLWVTPRSDPPAGEGPLGVAIVSKEEYFYFAPYWQRPILGIKQGFADAFNFSKLVGEGLITMVTQLAGGKVPQGVAGPVAIIAVTTEVTKLGFLPLLNFAGLISVNLAILNLVPFPPLDGSRVLFIILEKIFGKKKINKVEGNIYQIGMMILLALAVILTFKEVPKLVSAGSASKFIESLITK